jgi:hypothetical protein
MRRLFRKGERVRSKIDGKVVEVLKYIKKNLVEVMWFDMEKKEPRKNTIEEDKLSKAALLQTPCSVFDYPCIQIRSKKI